MTSAERRKLLERRKTLQTRKRIAGDKFPASAQSELDKIQRQLRQRRGKSIRKTVRSIQGTPSERAKPKSKKLNVDTSDVTLPKSKSGVSRLRMRKRAERDELIPKGATGPQPRGSDAPIRLTAPRPKRKPPAPKKQALPAPAMMFDANLQQTTPDVGAMSQGIEKVKKAKKKSVGGGRGTMAGNKGFETMKEYFVDDMSGRKSRVKTPFGTITIDSSDKGMAFEEYDAKFGGPVMPKVAKEKSRKGKRAAIRGRRAEMKGS